MTNPINPKQKGIKFLYGSSNIVSFIAWILGWALCAVNNSKPSLIFWYWFVDDILYIVYFDSFLVDKLFDI